jgi:hypothetical protein
MAISSDDLLPTPAGYATPAQLAEARSFAQRLDEENKNSGVSSSPYQGAANVVRAITSGLVEQEAAQQEQLARGDVAQRFAQLLMPQGQQPTSFGPSAPVSTAGSSSASLLPGNEGPETGDIKYGSGPVSMEAAKYAIAMNESGGNYGEVGPMITHGSYAGDRAVGKYQVMSKDLPNRLAAAGLPQMSAQDFLHNPQAQELEFEHEFGGLMSKYGSFNDAASMWFSGHPMRANDRTSDGYLSTPGYIAKANGSLAKYLAHNPQGSPTPTADAALRNATVGMVPGQPPTPAPGTVPQVMSDATVGMGGPGAQLAQNTAALPPPAAPVPPPGATFGQRFGNFAPATLANASPVVLPAPPAVAPRSIPRVGVGPAQATAPRPAVSAVAPTLGPQPAPQPAPVAAPPQLQPRAPIDPSQVYPPINQQELYEILRNPWIDQVDPGFKKDLLTRMAPQMIEGDNGDIWHYAPGRPPVLVRHGLGKEGTLEAGGVKIPQFYRTTPDGGITAVTPQGGFGGSVQDALDFANRQAQASAQAKAVGEEGGKAIMAPIGEAMKQAKTASNAMNDLNLIEDTVRNHGKGLVTGPLAEPWLATREALKGTFGVDIGDPRGLQASEIIKKLNAQLASAELPAFTQRGTQFDLKVFMANNPGLSQSPEGTLFLTDILKQYHRQSLGLAELAADPNNWGNWAQVQKNYLEQHKLTNPLTGHELGVYKDTNQQGRPTLSAPSINTEVGPKRFKYDAQGNRVQ